MSTNNLPIIENATIEIFMKRMWKVTANERYVLYRLDSYPEGTPAEDICYYRTCYLQQNMGAKYVESIIVAVPENTVSENQSPIVWRY